MSRAIFQSLDLAVKERATEGTKAQERVSELEKALRSAEDRAEAECAKSTKQQEAETVARGLLTDKYQFWRDGALALENIERHLIGELDAVKAEKVELLNVTQATKDRATAAEARKTDLETELKTMARYFNATNNRANAAEARKTDLESKLNATARQLEAAEDRENELGNQLGDLEDEVAEFEKSLSRSQAALASSQAKEKQLQACADGDRTKLYWETQKYEAKVRDMAELTSRAEAAEARADEFQSELDRWAELWATTESQLKTSIAQTRGWMEKSSQWKTKYLESDAEHSRLRHEVEAFNNRQRELKKQLDAAKSDIQKSLETFDG